MLLCNLLLEPLKALMLVCSGNYLAEMLLCILVVINILGTDVIPELKTK